MTSNTALAGDASSRTSGADRLASGGAIAALTSEVTYQPIKKVAVPHPRDGDKGSDAHVELAPTDSCLNTNHSAFRSAISSPEQQQEAALNTPLHCPVARGKARKHPCLTALHSFYGMSHAA
jgi:hypothetical protein